MRVRAIEPSDARYKGVVECEVCDFRQAGIYDDKDTAEQSVKRWAEGHLNWTRAHSVIREVTQCQN